MRVVIAEDEALLRQGLTRLLEDEGIEVVAAVGDAAALVGRTRVLRPDLVIVDIRMPPDMRDDGIRAALQLRAEFPDLAVMVLSQHVDAEGALRLVTAGADRVGYLLKQRVLDVDGFLAACRLVTSGGSAIDPDVVATMMGRQRADDPVSRLTPRQAEVLSLMAQGRGNAAIADELFITEKAVARHINAIFQTLDLPPEGDDHRRVRAVLQYLERSR